MPLTSILLILLAAAWQGNSVVLKPCPESPNCVNTYQEDDKHSPMTPLPVYGSIQESMQLLTQMIEEMPRTTLVRMDSTYLHVEFKIALFGFIDDVEFQVIDQNIHFRSASRKGYYDLGVNRNRMEDIQQAWKDITDNKKSDKP